MLFRSQSRRGGEAAPVADANPEYSKGVQAAKSRNTAEQSTRGGRAAPVADANANHSNGEQAANPTVTAEQSRRGGEAAPVANANPKYPKEGQAAKSRDTAVQSTRGGRAAPAANASPNSSNGGKSAKPRATAEFRQQNQLVPPATENVYSPPPEPRAPQANMLTNPARNNDYPARHGGFSAVTDVCPTCGRGFGSKDKFIFLPLEQGSPPVRSGADAIFTHRKFSFQNPRPAPPPPTSSSSRTSRVKLWLGWPTAPQDGWARSLAHTRASDTTLSSSWSNYSDTTTGWQNAKRTLKDQYERLKVIGRRIQKNIWGNPPP